MNRFIIIDGGEGVGKTTVLNHLRATYPQAVFTREPGGTPFAEQARALILSDAGHAASAEAQHCLFWAARADHVHKLIFPSLAKEKTLVFCDRFDSSTFAYQVQSRHSPLNKLFWQTRSAVLGRLAPRYIVLDTDEEISFSRVKARAQATGQTMTHFDASVLEEHAKRRHGFKQFASMLKEGWGEGVVEFVDATPPADLVAKAVLLRVEELLG